MHTNNHTRVECRVLCILARGGKVVEIPGREAEGVYETGEKRNDAGQTKAEFFEAHGLGRVDLEDAGAVADHAAAFPDGPIAERSDFAGVKISFAQDLLDRLVGQGFVTEKGSISKAGRDHVSAVHAGACKVADCDHDNHELLDAVLAETGFTRRGLSPEGCCTAAANIRTVIERFSPAEGS